MRREQYAHDIDLDWPTSKCQRALRPLKLKIASLERTLSTSQSVADGLTSWSSVLSHRRSKQDIATDECLQYHPKAANLRKYRGSRKQRTNVDLNQYDDVRPDAMLNVIRSRCSGAVGASYIAVYEAFTAIVSKAEPRTQFPSLATRAAYAVGRCVHLTSDSFSDQPIEAEDWYDAVPGHCRRALVVGHAVQLLLSSSKLLLPILPVVALCLHDSPLSHEIMTAILDLTILSDCRKSDVEYLSKLAIKVNMPWALKIHFTRELRLEQLTLASFSYLLELKSADPIDDYTQALYFKASTLAIQCLRRKKDFKSEADIRLFDVMQAISRRVFIDREAWILPLLQELYVSTPSAPLLEQLSLAYSLALLVRKPKDAGLVQCLQELSNKFLKSSSTIKDDCMTFLVEVFSSEYLVEVVECLVGKVDEMAIALANMCSTTFQEEFIEWADGIESAVFQVKNEGQTEKYRFEPLLDSWIAKTPGIPKTGLCARNLTIVSDSEDESSSVDEDGYDGDRSRTQLSIAELDCEDEDDLMDVISRSAKKMPTNVMTLLSVERSTDLTKSAKLLQRFTQCPSNPHDGSPLLRMRKKRTEQSTLIQSPTPRIAKRLNSTDDTTLPKPLTYHTRAKRTKLGKPGLTTADQVLPMTSRRGLRELNNLKSSFARKRKDVFPVSPALDIGKSTVGDDSSTLR